MRNSQSGAATLCRMSAAVHPPGLQVLQLLLLITAHPFSRFAQALHPLRCLQRPRHRHPARSLSARDPLRGARAQCCCTLLRRHPVLRPRVHYPSRSRCKRIFGVQMRSRAPRAVGVSCSPQRCPLQRATYPGSCRLADHTSVRYRQHLQPRDDARTARCRTPCAGCCRRRDAGAGRHTRLCSARPSTGCYRPSAPLSTKSCRTCARSRCFTFARKGGELELATCHGSMTLASKDAHHIAHTARRTWRTACA